MVQRIVVSLVDDLDAGPADQTVRFSLDGAAYEIDLSTANATTLREAFHPYALAARRTRTVKPVAVPAFPRPPGATAPAKPAARPRADRVQLAAIREWARGRGLPVGERGRIPAGIIEAYHHGS